MSRRPRPEARLRSSGRGALRFVLGGGLAALVLSSFLLVFCLGPAALAASEERAQRLQQLRAEISQLESDLVEAKARATDLAGRLEEVELELRLQERRTAEAVEARDLAAQRASDAELEVDRLEVALVRARRDLRNRVGGLYRLGQQGYLRLALAAKSDGDLLPAVRLIRYFAHRDAQAVGRFENTRAALEGQRDELVAQRDEVDEWTRREEERRGRLRALRTRQADLLAEAQAERRGLAERAVELAAEERQMAELVEGLLAAEQTPLAGTPIQDFRGLLDRPTAGPVAVDFGPRLDPRYRTRVPHNGIEITSEAGSVIRAVYPGQVLFAQPFQRYGPTVVVRHAGGVLSLYAGLSNLQVAKGDVLSLGTALGESGERLYFEIRVGNKPENPLEWVR